MAGDELAPGSADLPADGDELHDEHWDIVGWDEHPTYRDVGSLSYWNEPEACRGGWFLVALGRRYRWINWDTAEDGEYHCDDEVAAFWRMVESVDTFADIDQAEVPFGGEGEADILDRLADALPRLKERGSIVLNGSRWVLEEGSWRPLRKHADESD